MVHNILKNMRPCNILDMSCVNVLIYIIRCPYVRIKTTLYIHDCTLLCYCVGVVYENLSPEKFANWFQLSYLLRNEYQYIHLFILNFICTYLLQIEKYFTRISFYLKINLLFYFISSRKWKKKCCLFSFIFIHISRIF